MGRVQHLDSDEDSRSPPAKPRKRSRSPSAKPRKRSPSAKPRKRSRSASAKPKKRRRHSKLDAEASEKPAAQPAAEAAAPSPAPAAAQAPVQASAMPAWLANPPVTPGVSGMAGAPGMPGLAGPAAGAAGQPQGFGFTAGGFVKSGEAKVETTHLDLSKPKSIQTMEVPIQRELVSLLMTPENNRLLSAESGATIEWAPDRCHVILSGSDTQLQRGQKLLSRVSTHCRWGQSPEKVRRLLKPKRVESVLCRLSPMGSLLSPKANLPTVRKTLSALDTTISIGKGPDNHVIIPDPHRVVSRVHTVLELDCERGAVYILDCSTNGTFLNGIPLPEKSVGKVLLSHGDEILFKDQSGGRHEFGYIVNLDEKAVKEDIVLEAPRRLLSPQELSSASRGDY